MGKLHVDPDTGRVTRDDDTQFTYSPPTHTPDGVPIERPPDVIVVSRHWYEGVTRTVEALREELEAYRKTTRRETDGE